MNTTHLAHHIDFLGTALLYQGTFELFQEFIKNWRFLICIVGVWNSRVIRFKHTSVWTNYMCMRLSVGTRAPVRTQIIETDVTFQSSRIWSTVLWKEHVAWITLFRVRGSKQMWKSSLWSSVHWDDLYKVWLLRQFLRIWPTLSQSMKLFSLRPY